MDKIARSLRNETEVASENPIGVCVQCSIRLNRKDASSDQIMDRTMAKPFLGIRDIARNSS